MSKYLGVAWVYRDDLNVINASKDDDRCTNIHEEVNPAGLRICIRQPEITNLHKCLTYEGRDRILHVLARRSNVQRNT